MPPDGAAREAGYGQNWPPHSVGAFSPLSTSQVRRRLTGDGNRSPVPRPYSSIASSGGSNPSSRSGSFANRLSAFKTSPVRKPARASRRYAAAKSFWS
jgi:hypothetical protein